MKNIKTLAILIISSIITGCASSYKIQMTQEFIESKPEVNMGSFLAQKEMDARMPVSNTGTAVGMQFGLIGVLIGSAIDSSKNKNNLNNKETQIAPLRNALIDHDFNTAYHQSVLNTTHSMDWLNLGKVTKVDDFATISFEQNQYFLKYDTSYSLNRNFDSLELFTFVTLYKIEKNQSKKKNKETVIFRNLYKYLSPSIPLIAKSQEEIERSIAEVEEWHQLELERIEKLPTKRKTPKINALNKKKKKKLKASRSAYTWAERNLAMAKHWAKDDASMIKSYMQEALVEIDKMIKLDILDTKSPKEYKKDKSIPLHIKGLQKVSDSNGRLILRSVSNTKGLLCSIKSDMDAKRCIIAQ